MINDFEIQVLLLVFVNIANKLVSALCKHRSFYDVDILLNRLFVFNATTNRHTLYKDNDIFNKNTNGST